MVAAQAGRVLSGRPSRELGRIEHNASMNGMAFGLSVKPMAATNGESQTSTIRGLRKCDVR